MARMKKIKQDWLHIGFISYKKELLYKDKKTEKYLSTPTSNTITEEIYRYVYFDNERDLKQYEEKGFTSVSEYYKYLQNAINLNGILQEFIQKYRKPLFSLINPNENISIKKRRKSLLKLASSYTVNDFIKETLDYFNQRSDRINVSTIIDFPLNEYKIHPDLLKQLPFIFEYGAILLFRPECEFVLREEGGSKLIQENSDNEKLIELLHKIDQCSSIEELESIKKSYPISYLTDKFEEKIKNKSFKWNDIDMIKIDRYDGCPMFVYNTKHLSLNLQINHKVSINEIKKYITEKNIAPQIKKLDDTDNFAVREVPTFMVETKMKTGCTYALLTDAVIKEFSNDKNASKNDDSVQKAFERSIKKIYLLFRFKDENQNIEFLNEFYKLHKN